MIQAYLTEFIRLIFQEARAKFPTDPSLLLSYAHFALFYMHNSFVCLNLLRTFEQSKNLSFFDRLNYKLNEAFLIHTIRTFISKKNDYENGYSYRLYGVVADERKAYTEPTVINLIQEEKLDSEHFIHINLLYLNYHQSILYLGVEIIDFWKYILS